MSERIDADDRIGTYPAEVLENLRRWLDEGNPISGGEFEVVRHIVDHPERHERDINAVFEEEMTYRDLREDFDRATPKKWGYPADTWETADRIHELRTGTELDGREAAVRALSERDRTHDEIAAMFNVSKSVVEGHSDRINRVME